MGKREFDETPNTGSGYIPIVDDDTEMQPRQREAWETVSRAEIDSWLKKHHKGPASDKWKQKARDAIIAEKKRTMLPRGKSITISNTDQPRQIVYGATRISAFGAMAHQNGASKEWFNMILTLSGCELTSVDKLIIDEKIEVTFSPGSGWATGPTVGNRVFANKIFLSTYGTLGDDDQVVNPDAFGVIPTIWTANHRQRGCGYAYMILVWDALTWPNGRPEIHFDVHGKSVYDPRDTTVRWTDNPVLCTADYLADTRNGPGFSYDDFDLTSLNAAANICDELVATKAGPNEKRYTLNGCFNLDKEPRQILEELCSSWAGRVVPFNGKLKFIAGKAQTPISITLTDNDLRGDVNISLMKSRSDRYNSIKGKITYPGANYELTDVPPISIAAYVTEDSGNVQSEEINLPFTESLSMAQRILRINLEENRRDLEFSTAWSLKAYPISVGDWVSVTLARYGFTAKTFRVMKYGFGVTGEGEVTVKLDLREIDSGAYAWTPAIDEQTINQAPNTTLPIFSATAPSNLALASGTTHLYTRADGTIFSRIYVSWDLPYDIFIQSGGYFDLQYKQTAASTWSDLAPVLGDQSHAYILDVQDGVAYDVRIRSRNLIGTVSSWVTASNHTVIGKTAAPSDVTGLSVTLKENGYLIAWTGIDDLDLRDYEVRYGNSWAGGTYINRVAGTGYLWDRPVAGTYKIMVKARDTSLNYSTTEAYYNLTVTAPGVVQALNGTSAQNAVLLDWEAPASGSLQIASYNVYKGATFAGAELLGSFNGTFATYLEKLGGTFTYWIVAVDVAGNIGSAASVSTTVRISSKYAIKSNSAAPLPLANFSQVAMFGKSISDVDLPPGITEATFSAHWSNKSTITVDSALRIASITDLSGNSKTISQGTDGNKPVRSGTTQAENLQANSNVFSSGYVNAGTVAVTATAAAAANPLTGEVNASSWIPNAASGKAWYYRPATNRVTGVGYRVILHVKRNAAPASECNRYLLVGIDGGNGAYSRFDLVSGTVQANSGSAVGAIQALAGGWYRLTVSKSSVTSPGGSLDLILHQYPSHNTASTYDGTSGIYIYNHQSNRQIATNENLVTGAMPVFMAQNGLIAPFFDGSDDTLSNANDLIGIGDVTVACAFIAQARSAAGVQRFLDNAKFILGVNIDDRIAVYSDGGTAVYSTAITYGVAHTLVVTRTSAGVVNIYVDGVLSGSANQASGTPAGGSPTYFGNRAALDRAFKGAIPEMAIIPSIATASRIAALHDFLKKKWVDSYTRFVDSSAQVAGIYLPATTGETVATHFTNNSKTTSKGFSDAGYTKILEPVPTTLSYVEYTVDLGSTIVQGLLELSWRKADQHGSPTIVSTISTSPDNVTFTDYVSTSALASNFRYVKVRIATTTGDAKVFSKLSNIALLLRLAKETDAGQFQCYAADASGTVRNFGVPFLNVEKINVTPINGTVACSYVIIFDYSTANPTSFAVKFFDKDGARIDYACSYDAEGVIAQ